MKEGGGKGHPRADRSKKRRAPPGWWVARRGVGGGTSRRTPRRNQRGGFRRGVVVRSRRDTRGGGVRPGCACGPTGRGRACVRRGGVGAARHRSGPGKTPRGGGLSPIRSADRPRQPLWGGDRGGRGAGPGRHPVRGPGRTPLLVVVAGRAKTPRHATRGLCSGRGVLQLARSAAPQLWTAHPRGPSQNIPIRACKGMTCPDLGEIGFGRGAGLFLSGFSSHPTSCLNFLLWRDLSVWRIWGGYFGHRRSGLGGVY